MSNPGVIKLARKQIGAHNLWLDDNIGESIHIHYDQFRVDLSVKEFLHLCDELREVIRDIVPVDLTGTDDRTLSSKGRDLLKIENMVIEEHFLSEFFVYDDEGICSLCDCNRVKALRNEKDIDSTQIRKTNFYDQTNSDRLYKCLEFVKDNGYPFNDSYIWVNADNMCIMDGWHRAACLYYLYGDIKVKVKMVEFKKDGSVLPGFVETFPVDAISKKSRLILYGAGKNGRALMERLQNEGFAVTAWVDRNAKGIGEIKGIKIYEPEEITGMEYEYILISVEDPNVLNEILVNLYGMGVDYNKIITN